MNLPPIKALSVLEPRRRSQRLTRISRSASPYTVHDDGDVIDVTPVHHTPLYPQRTLSAQLLDMGLHHHVEGLIRKAGAETRIPVSAATAGHHYDDAAHDFSGRGQHLFRWRV